jgi:hypothetical protein
MKTPMKYTFDVGNPYRRDRATHHQARCGADIYRNGTGAEQLGAAPYVTVNGRVTAVAKYRADRVAAALSATQNLTLNDVRRLAWLAKKQDYRWELLVSLVRSVLDNVSTVEMEHPLATAPLSSS